MCPGGGQGTPGWKQCDPTGTVLPTHEPTSLKVAVGAPDRSPKESRVHTGLQLLTLLPTRQGDKFLYFRTCAEQGEFEQ